VSLALDNPGVAMRVLADVEHELAENQNVYEQAATDRAVLIRQWEHRLAICRMTAKGNDADGRKAAALSMAIERDDLYERLMDAEGRFEGQKALMRTLETRASVAQSVLRSQGRV
jgi:hypothetical protein